MKNRYQRKEEAKERTENRTARRAEQQIQVLDSRLGVGVGAVKERTRLQKMIG